VLVERLERAANPTRGRSARSTGAPDRYLASLLEHRTRSVERDLEWVDELIAAERAAMPDPGRPASSVA
jgi:hypothetical protein